MTREEKISLLIDELEDIRCNNFDANTDEDKTLKEAVRVIKALEQDSCDDVISRQAVLELVADYDLSMGQVVKGIHELPSVNPQAKTRHCKDCKWWKDSDGLYRRGGHAESQCPINRKEVFEGNGYCYMFEPQESEVSNADSN